VCEQEVGVQERDVFFLQKQGWDRSSTLCELLRKSLGSGLPFGTLLISTTKYNSVTKSGGKDLAFDLKPRVMGKCHDSNTLKMVLTEILRPDTVFTISQSLQHLGVPLFTTCHTSPNIPVYHLLKSNYMLGMSHFI
jgi:hypothetical protein